jgi:hypothetical protein
VLPALACLAALGLAACQETTGGALGGRMVDAPGVPIALDAIEGAPEALSGKVNDAVVNQALQRRIDLVSPADPARYHLKGYLTAAPTEAGETELTLVWDVFDASRRRAQRVTSTASAPGQSSDPWERVGDVQIMKVTAQSMNEVAAFIRGGGEAVAASAGGGPALGYSTQQ